MPGRIDQRPIGNRKRGVEVKAGGEEGRKGEVGKREGTRERKESEACEARGRERETGETWSLGKRGTDKTSSNQRRKR